MISGVISTVAIVISPIRGSPLIAYWGRTENPVPWHDPCSLASGGLQSQARLARDAQRPRGEEGA